MWFPNEKLQLQLRKPKYKVKDKVIYTKDDNQYIATVVGVNFKSVNIGYIYGIETELSINGISKFLVKENNLKHYKNVKSKNGENNGVS